MGKTAFLFFTHQVNESIIKRYELLQQAVDANKDVYFVYHQEEEISFPEKMNVYTFNYKSLSDLNFIAISETIVPGSIHFALIQFFQDFPVYDYYWCIEYDVIFNGEWGDFFKYFSESRADLLTTHIKTFHEDPRWFWWKYIRLIDKVLEPNILIRSFNPIYRLSNRALALLKIYLSKGNVGHYEVFIPTILNNAGYEIIDIGGSGSFVRPGDEEKFYLSSDKNVEGGTMRYRPIFEEKDILLKNRLYHPVK